MSSSEHKKNEAKRNPYDTCDPQYLRELREAAGIDMLVLARTACLSVAQVRQLETDDSDSLFYSDAIKRQAYKRLLMILGAEPPSVEVPHDLHDASKVAQAHLNTLDQIVAMSQQPAMNRTSADVFGMGAAKIKQHKQVVSAMMLLLIAVGLLIMYGPQSDNNAVSTVSPAPRVTASSVVSSAQDNLPEPSPVSVASQAASAPTPTIVASIDAPPAVAANNNSGCAYSEDALPQLTPFIAQKEGRYVYVISPINTEICVVDGNKQATTLQMKAGESRSVYGVSPWQVSSAHLSKIQIYFQGGRVTLPDAATRVKLVEVPLSR